MSAFIQKIALTLVLLFFISCSTQDTRPSVAEVEPSPSETVNAVNNSPITEGPTKETWQKAIFMGLRMGVDSRDEALTVLGKPGSSGDPEEVDQDKKDPVLVDGYSNFNEIYDTLLVTSSKKTGIVYNIIATLKGQSIDSVTQLYGNNYTRGRYKFFECPGDSTTANIIESSDGDLEYMEYRSKGISISLDQGRVRDIEFVSGPVGLQSPKCPK